MGDMDGLAALGADELVHVCSFLDWRDIVNLSLAFKGSCSVIRRSPWIWQAAYGAALPYSSRLPTLAEARGTFIRLRTECLSNSEKVLRRCVEATIEGAVGGQRIAKDGVLAVPPRSKLDYGYSVSPLLTWSQLVKCQAGAQLEYRPARGPSLLQHSSDADRADNVGVALIRRTFPFGSSGTALFGRPTLRYFEATILPPRMGQEEEDLQNGAGHLPASIAPRRRCGMSLGVAESRQALSMLSNGLHCGWYSGPWDGSMQSVGYHANEGRLFPALDDSRWEWNGQRGFGPAYGPGDTVGCGVDLARGLLFFTLNGRAVGVVAPGAALPPDLPGYLSGCGPVRHVQPLALRQSQLAVCLQSPGDRVALNLGQAKFLFDLGKDPWD